MAGTAREGMKKREPPASVIVPEGRSNHRIIAQNKKEKYGDGLILSLKNHVLLAWS